MISMSEADTSVDLYAPIPMFVGEWAWLSDDWACKIGYNGHIYKSATHAFQAAKCAELKEHDAVWSMATASGARRAGERCARWKDWDDVKESEMASIQMCKFGQNEDLKDKLLATGDRDLVNGGLGDDDFWGKVPVRMSGGQVREWRGENVLGEILMAVRDRLRSEVRG